MGSQAAGFGPRLVLGGTAVVCCVHDRKKREVVTEEQVRLLGLEAGIIFKPGIHRLHECSCCSNLFVEDGTEARHCQVCRSIPPVHALGGPLPEPKGVVG